MSVCVIHLSGWAIFRQLQLEEALLRADTRNFLILNQGAPSAIVVGISGKVEELIDIPAVQQRDIPVIRRCSGGGTVIVDEDTLFVTFIGNKALLSPRACYPEPILRWGEELFQQAWGLPDFALRENDFVLGNRKCGGNAQYLQRDRWLLHTSFLWNFRRSFMDLLLHPRVTPKYRQDREHTEFLCTLHQHFKHKHLPCTLLLEHLATRWVLHTLSTDDIEEALRREHRRATTQLTF